MREQKITRQRKIRRVARTRRKIETQTKLSGVPRLSIFRSNRYFYVQIIDDRLAKTLVSGSDRTLSENLPKSERAKEVGKQIAEAAKKKKISAVVFDRGHYRYHGRVKQFAEAAREGGLQF